MEKTSDLICTYVFKRIIDFNSNYKDLVTKTVKILKNEVCESNNCDTFESTVHRDFIVIRCNDENVIKQFERVLFRDLPENILICPHYTENPISYEDIRGFQKNLNLPLGKLIFQSIQVIKKCIEQFTIKNIFLSFNGGKDCVVVLHLYQAVLDELQFNEPIKAVYFQSGDQFSEEENFVQSTVKRFNLDLTIIKGELKSGLYSFLIENPQFHASIIGTRQTDTGSTKLQFFQKTDSDWPTLIRIQPILHWDYDNIWSFLRQFSIPYCCLYDKGYSSLGSKSKSHPNPNLKYMDEKTGEIKYWPAFLLQNGNSERENRF